MEPVKRVPLVHQVEDQIEKLIKEEAYAPGTKLPTEMELCQALGVSRGTIREAFRYLQAKGVVELITGKGAFVAAQRNLENPEALIWLGRALRRCACRRAESDPRGVHEARGHEEL